MDLITFFNSLVSRWRLIVMIWISIIVICIIYILLLPTLYQSRGTYIIRPIASIELGEDLVNAIDTLSRRVEINSTFAEIASSRNVKEKVIKNLSLSSGEIQNLRIASNTISGTNVLEISVIATNPDLALMVAGEVAKQTLSSAREIYDVFELELLDDFERPNKPIDSNKGFIILLGILFGLVAGVGTVFIIEFVNIQLLGIHSVQFVDRQTGKYTRSYFDHRLTQEISRSSRNKYNYSLALIRLLDHSAEEESKPAQISNEKFDMMYDLLRTSFREEDVIAQYDLDTIGLLIPDLVGDDTRNRIESIINEQKPDSENENNDLNDQNFAVGIVSVEDHHKSRDELLRLLSQAVFLASEEESDGIYLRTDKDNSRTTPGG